MAVTNNFFEGQEECLQIQLAVKLLIGIQSRADEKHHQQQQPTSSRSQYHFRNVPQSYKQQPHQPEASAGEYILTVPETQMPVSQAIPPDQQTQELPRGQQNTTDSYLVVEVQQAGTLKTTTFHHQSNQGLQPIVIRRCHSQRKFTQHQPFLTIYSRSCAPIRWIYYPVTCIKTPPLLQPPSSKILLRS